MKTPRIIGLLKSLKKDTRGAAAIEVGLTMIMTTMLLLGTFDLANQFLDQRELEEVARSGVQVALAKPGQAANLALIEQATAIAAGPGADTMTISARQYCRCYDAGGALGADTPCAGIVCGDGNIATSYIEVTVSRLNNPLLSYPNVVIPRTLTGSATLQIQ